ncbi:hypothetical protein MKW98_021174 [Papaver atlanticum]|uniref:Uncharacterized protein n=1 Tax=Papaver atlanticum TaxID=357466 RepID=A0AAD4XT19_9MAGN|nr:hypothetical protein MKW98_021174 [Papaver atlanticum]
MIICFFSDCTLSCSCDKVVLKPIGKLDIQGCVGQLNQIHHHQLRPPHHKISINGVEPRVYGNGVYSRLRSSGRRIGSMAIFLLTKHLCRIKLDTTSCPGLVPSADSPESDTEVLHGSSSNTSSPEPEPEPDLV